MEDTLLNLASDSAVVSEGTALPDLGSQDYTLPAYIAGAFKPGKWINNTSFPYYNRAFRKVNADKGINSYILFNVQITFIADNW